MFDRLHSIITLYVSISLKSVLNVFTHESIAYEQSLALSKLAALSMQDLVYLHCASTDCVIWSILNINSLIGPEQAACTAQQSVSQEEHKPQECGEQQEKCSSDQKKQKYSVCF